jgi:hypothetical protein
VLETEPEPQPDHSPLRVFIKENIGFTLGPQKYGAPLSGETGYLEKLWVGNSPGKGLGIHLVFILPSVRPFWYFAWPGPSNANVICRRSR